VCETNSLVVLGGTGVWRQGWPKRTRYGWLDGPNKSGSQECPLLLAKAGSLEKPKEGATG